MEASEDHPFTILLHINILNYLILVLPLAALIIGTAIHFGTKENIKYNFPYITDVVPYQPEGKIVSIFMMVSSIIMFIIFYSRLTAFKIMRKLKPKMSEKKYKPAMMTLSISGYICVAFHFLMTFISVGESEIAHAIFVNIMYLSGIVYMFALDITLKTIYLSSRMFSRILSMASFAVTFSFLVLRYFIPMDQGDAIRITIANLFGDLAFICLYTKIFIVKFDIPPIGVRVSRRISIN